MPKTVDHASRRRELLDALLAVVVRDGLDAVSIRTVAAEAGCSSRPVQYYFTDKAELLAAAHERVSERMGHLVTSAVRALGEEPDPRSVVEAIVYAFLPTTDEARNSLIAYYAFYAAELTDPAARIPNATAAPTGLARVIRAQVERDRGRTLSTAEIRDVALLVLSVSTISSSVIACYHTLAEATTLLQHQIDRLLPKRAPAPKKSRST